MTIKYPYSECQIRAVQINLPHPPEPDPEPPDPTALTVRLKSWLQKPDVGGSNGSFLLQNPSHPTRLMLSTNSSNSGNIKLRFEEIWWVFLETGIFSRFRQFFFFFFQISNAFFIPTTQPGPTDAHPHSKSTRPILRRVEFGFLRPPPNTYGSSSGWVQTRLVDSPNYN